MQKLSCRQNSKHLQKGGNSNNIDRKVGEFIILKTFCLKHVQNLMEFVFDLI